MDNKYFIAKRDIKLFLGKDKTVDIKKDSFIIRNELNVYLPFENITYDWYIFPYIKKDLRVISLEELSNIKQILTENKKQR